MEPNANIARRAASRLASRIDPSLPMLTERILDGEEPPRSHASAESIPYGCAVFLVSVAGLAWSLCVELRKGRRARRLPPDPGKELMIQRVGEEITALDRIPVFLREDIIEAVVEEALAQEEPSAIAP
jgi:hypothetical protein